MCSEALLFQNQLAGIERVRLPPCHGWRFFMAMSLIGLEASNGWIEIHSVRRR